MLRSAAEQFIMNSRRRHHDALRSIAHLNSANEQSAVSSHDPPAHEIAVAPIVPRIAVVSVGGVAITITVTRIAETTKETMTAEISAVTAKCPAVATAKPAMAKSSAPAVSLSRRRCKTCNGGGAKHKRRNACYQSVLSS